MTENTKEKEWQVGYWKWMAKRRPKFISISLITTLIIIIMNLVNGYPKLFDSKQIKVSKQDLEKDSGWNILNSIKMEIDDSKLKSSGIKSRIDDAQLKIEKKYEYKLKSNRKKKNLETLVILMNLLFISGVISILVFSRNKIYDDADTIDIQKLETLLNINTNKNKEFNITSRSQSLLRKFSDLSKGPLYRRIFAKWKFKNKDLQELASDILQKHDSSISETSNLVARAKISIDQFYKNWVMVWVTWLFYYSYKLSAELGEYGENGSKMTENINTTIESTLNSFNSIFIFMCFVVTSMVTVRMQKQDDIYIAKDTSNVRFWFIIGIIFLIFIEILIKGFDIKIFDVKNLGFYFEALHGFIASISLILLTSLFDNRLTDSGFSIIFLIYFYAALQVLFPLLTNEINDDITLIPVLLIFSTFIFKIFFYSFFNWMFDTKRFLFYFIRFSIIFNESREKWRLFGEVIADNGNSTDVKTLQN